MNKKEKLENILTLTKSLSILYCNGFIESSNKKIVNMIGTGLNKTLEMQKELYKYMSENGIYQIKNIDTKEISKTLKKLIA